MSGRTQTKHTHLNTQTHAVPSLTHSVVLVPSHESHYLGISMLLCTGERVWERRAAWVETYISVYHSHSPVVGLVLSLDSADSPGWAYLRADYGEHGVFSPPLPHVLTYLLLALILFSRTACTEKKNTLGVLETPQSRYAV